MKIKITNKGFTLIEIITAIAIMGIIGGFGSIFLMNMFQSYQLADDNAHLAQKAQVALTRIAVEMAYANKGSITVSGNTITYNATYPDDTQESGNKFELVGSELLLIVDVGNDVSSFVLTDSIYILDNDGFTITSDAGYITVTLRMIGINEAPQTFIQTMAVP